MNMSPKQLVIGSLVAGLVTLGGVGLANAQTDDVNSTETTVVADDQSTEAADPTNDDADGPSRPERTEVALTGDLATQVTDAAIAAVPGGTVERVETDDGDAEYEAHMTNADGDRVTVTFDADIQVLEIREGGQGGGDCHDGGGHREPDADSTAQVESGS